MPSDMTPRPISSSDLEVSLARLAAMTKDPLAGVFGPQSAVWRIQREALVFFGAGRAMLLQTAHPWVAQGVARQSRALKDPIGRFHRTFVMMFSLSYGSTEQAFARARQLHGIHSKIHGQMDETVGPFPKGSAYSANDVNAMLWVHATLWDTAIMMHEAVMGPMDPALKAAYYAETRRFAQFFGIPDDMVPADLPAFEAYVAGMLASGTLAVGPAGRHIAQALMAGRGPGFWPGVPGWYRGFTASLLPETLREGFGLTYSDKQAARAELSWTRIRTFYPKLPERLRHVPPYREALGRIAGKKGPDVITRALNLAWIGRSRLVS